VWEEDGTLVAPEQRDVKHYLTAVFVFKAGLLHQRNILPQMGRDERIDCLPGDGRCIAFPSVFLTSRQRVVILASGL
jgi:hypothetical protein